MTPQASFATEPFSFIFDQNPPLRENKNQRQFVDRISVHAHSEEFLRFEVSGSLASVYHTDGVKQLNVC